MNTELIRALMDAGATDVEMRWSPGLEVRVMLRSMDWDVRANCLAAIERYLNEQDYLTGAAVRFGFPEPRNFTEAYIKRVSV